MLPKLLEELVQQSIESGMVPPFFQLSPALTKKKGLFKLIVHSISGNNKSRVAPLSLACIYAVFLLFQV
jgi:hypothetical protein